MEKLRQEMDKPADYAVKSVFESGKRMDHFVEDLKKNGIEP